MNIMFYNIKPIYEEGFLILDDNHKMYFKVSGNPNGIPILLIHGGPGGGSLDETRKYFDHKVYKIVQYDQRGCGKSFPNSDLRNNDTTLLLKDIDMLRSHLNIDKWFIYGGSWGATLALLYAISNKERLLGLLLRGTMLGTDDEVRRFFINYKLFFPEKYYEFFGKFGSTEDIPQNIYKRMISCDLFKRTQLATNYCKYFAYSLSINPSKKLLNSHANKTVALPLAMISLHYWVNSFFIGKNFIINHISSIRDIKTIIIHGRYDLLSSVSSSFELNQGIKNSSLVIVENSGHSLDCKEIELALKHGADQLKILE